MPALPDPLRSAYSTTGIKGNENEFLSYRLLHAVLTNVRSSVSSIIEKLTPQQMGDEAVKHAVDVCDPTPTLIYLR